MLYIKNSTVSGGAPPGWYALTTNGNEDYGNNVGWIFSAAAPSVPPGNFFFFYG